MFLHTPPRPDPARAFREAFGDRTAEELLLKDGQPVDGALIEEYLDRLSEDGLRFIRNVGRAGPSPCDRLAA